MQDAQKNEEGVLVSFIIPYYNIKADMLRECVGSIFSVALAPSQREVILVDDGSRDYPMDHLAEWESDIRYVHKDNGGLSSARNAGMSMANGRYIQFVDADDALRKDGYDRCLDLLKETKPDILMFAHSSDLNRKAEGGRTRVWESGAAFMTENNLSASAWGYIFRRSIADDLAFTQGILHEDEEFTPLLLLRAGKTIKTDIDAYFYREREDSIMHKTDDEWAKRRLNDMEGVIMRLNGHLSHLDHKAKEGLQRRVDQLCMDYIYNIAKLTHSRKCMKQRIDRLRQNGLFPLPKKHYTAKYHWFAVIVDMIF